jgi:integrase
MKGPFQIITRNYKSKKSYHARFLDSDGQVFKELKLDGVNSRIAATLAAKSLFDQGIIRKDDDPFALDFIDNFWSEDSLYVRQRERHGMVLSSRYIEESRKDVHRRFGTYLKGRRLSQITPLLIERAIDDFDRAGVGTRSINKALQALKVPVNWHCKLCRIPNPLMYVSKIKETPRERTILSPAEVSALVKLKDVDLRYHAIVLLGALCGLRLGEVRGLQWADVDFKQKLIQVRHNCPYGTTQIKVPKWNSSRVVPLPHVLERIFKQIPLLPKASSLFVIYNQSDATVPVHEITIKRAFEKMLSEIKIDHVTQKARALSFHCLRHTFITLTRAGGVSDFIVQKLAGHKSAKMMERYTHAENVIDYSSTRATMQHYLDKAGRQKPVKVKKT